MLASCKSKWGLKGNMMKLGDEKGEQLRKEKSSTRMASACVKMRSLQKVLKKQESDKRLSI